MRYPTDEELMELVENLEAEPLFDPPHLKENIAAEIGKIALTPISRSMGDAKIRIVKDSSFALPSSGKKQKRRNWKQGNFVYNVKVIAGMAAALVLIFLLPLDINTLTRQEQAYEQRIEMVEIRFENEQGETESELDKIFRISATAITETGSMILDKLNIFDGLFDKP
ncbi:MAG: hypothetical protein FWE14_05485 [Lachnospiraceae bacterium]|nr:hypothetical protein [Lachnospiraceae bacterium]